MSQLTRSVLENLLLDLEPKDNFIVNVNDLLSMRRIMREKGLTARRVLIYRDDGTVWKSSYYKIFDKGIWVGTLYVDTAGWHERDKMSHFKTPQMTLDIRRPPKIEWNNDYSLDSILLHTRFGWK